MHFHVFTTQEFIACILVIAAPSIAIGFAIGTIRSYYRHQKARAAFKLVEMLFAEGAKQLAEEESTLDYEAPVVPAKLHVTQEQLSEVIERSRPSVYCTRCGSKAHWIYRTRIEDEGFCDKLIFACDGCGQERHVNVMPEQNVRVLTKHDDEKTAAAVIAEEPDPDSIAKGVDHMPDCCSVCPHLETELGMPRCGKRVEWIDTDLEDSPPEWCPLR